MATRYAVASGNWSNVATWDGGVSLPATGDTVHANGFTVTIDQNISVDSLRTTSGAGIVAGGFFQVTGSGYQLTITGNPSLLHGGTKVLDISANCTIVAPNTLYVDSLSSGVGVLVISAGTTTITGNVQQYQRSGNSQYCVQTTGSASLSITGNLIHGSGANLDNHLIGMVSTGTLTITGNISTAITNGTGRTVYINNTCTVVITGTITNSSTGGTIPVWAQTGSPVITITGTVSGGNNRAVYLNAPATLTVNGAVTPGTSEPGIGSVSASSITLNGTATAGSGVAAVVSSNASSLVRIAGNVVDHPTTGQSAIYAVRMEGNWTTPSYRRLKSGGGTVDIVTTDSLSGLPTEADVRLGTLYGATSEFMGELAIPPASSVMTGVPVDATVGTAVLDPADLASAVWDHLTANATTPGSIGLRIKDAATVDSTGAQFAAFQG